MIFVIKKETKEVLLVSWDEEPAIKEWGCYNNDYDAIFMKGNEMQLKDLTTEKNGKMYLNFEYVEDN